MFKNNLNKCLIIALVMIGLACKKDEQKANQAKINEVNIASEITSFTLVQFDSLKIAPKLIESKPGDQYVYQWKMYPKSSGLGENVVILSTQKDLKAKLNQPPGSYNIQYKVTSSVTGLSSILLYEVDINGALYEGWNICNNKGGKGQLSFLRADGEVFFNPAEAVNNTTYPGKAISASSGVYLSSFAMTYYFTDQGIYRFNANDFVYSASNTGIYPGGFSVSGKVCYGMSKGQYDQYLISDGNLHVAFGPESFYPEEVLKPFSERLAGDYSLFAGVIASDYNSTYFYDNKNMRFMQVYPMERSISIAGATPSRSFNLANVGKTLIAMDYGKRSFFSDEIYLIMQDQAGLRYLYSINGTTPGLNQVIGNSVDIDKAIAYATSSSAKHMYYATDNKIYLYDMLINSSRVVYTFPSAYKIKDIKMPRTSSKKMVAAVNRGDLGEMYYFDLDNLGDFVGNTYNKKIEGFGEITHISYRVK